MPYGLFCRYYHCFSCLLAIWSCWFASAEIDLPIIATNENGVTEFQFTIENKPVRFAIQPNWRWRSSTYRSMVVTDNGTLIEHDDVADDEHWRLSDLDDGSSGVEHASISVHDRRISAFVAMSDSTTIHIGPGNATHHIIEVGDRQRSHRHLLDSIQPLHERDGVSFAHVPNTPAAYNCSLSKPTKYIEILVVNDFARHERLAQWTTAQTRSVINIADGYYAAASFETCIRIVLIGQLTFRSATPNTITYRPCNTPSASADVGCWSCSDDSNGCQRTSVRSDQYDSAMLLRSFRQWRLDNAAVLTEKFGSVDAVHLFSGRDFDGQVRGLAYLDTICKQSISAVAVIESTARVPSYHAQIFAHELGHNMGLVHDSDRGFIMSPTSSALTYSTNFSPGSVNTMNAVNLSTCLSAVRQTPVEHVCGDGIVDPTEECDPGLAQDDCCINCKIDRPRCRCANTEPCCENGRHKKAGVVCRPSRNNECDHVETCTGDSAQCPDDQFESTSTSCRDFRGVASNCFLGQCVLSRQTQCSVTNEPDAAADPSNSGSARARSSKVAACPTTKLCSRLHCSSSRDQDCDQVWTSSAADGSPCGPSGPGDVSHVCVSGYCVETITASHKAFVCAHGSIDCIVDDLSILDSSRWPTIETLLVALTCVIACAMLCLCCYNRRPIRPMRRVARPELFPVVSQQLQRPIFPGA